MRKALIALSLLAGLAGSSIAIPADAAPLAHDLPPSVEALLLTVNVPTDVALNEGASIQTVQYYRHRRYNRRFYRNRY